MNGDRGSKKERVSRKRRKRSTFYNTAISEAERLELPKAFDVEGLDEEIALLRIRLNRLMKEHPEDVDLLFKGLELLVKAVAARYRLSDESKENLGHAIDNVLKQIGGAFGLEGFNGA